MIFSFEGFLLFVKRIKSDTIEFQENFNNLFTK